MSDKPRPIFINRYRRTDDFVIIGGTTTANRAEAEKRAAAAEEAKKSNSDRGLMLRGSVPLLHKDSYEDERQNHLNFYNAKVPHLTMPFGGAARYLVSAFALKLTNNYTHITHPLV